MNEQKYTQNWRAYDAAQCSEKTIFMKLLAELCRDIDIGGCSCRVGRPNLSLSDMYFCAIMKVYSMRSLRRFMGDLQIAKEKGFIEKVPSFSSLGHFFQDETATEVLRTLISESSLPLKSVETDFAADSSGFTTSSLSSWYEFRYGKSIAKRKWVKAHIMCGVKTNVVTSVIISNPRDNDSPFLKDMLEDTARNFTIDEISADRAYSSRENLEIVRDVGGTAYIPFKSNTSGKSRGSLLWKQMYHYFMYNQEEFMQHYHKRSNVETTFHMIKTKFGDTVKSKDQIAQANEVLCKILCHNLCVLIQEMHELSMDTYVDM